MADLSPEQARAKTKRGKSSTPKRPYEPGRAVVGHDGAIVAVLRGRHLTDADVDQARDLVAWMPRHHEGGQQ